MNETNLFNGEEDIAKNSNKNGEKWEKLYKSPITASIFTLLIVTTFFTIFSKGTFVSLGNIASILAISTDLAALSYGETLIIIQGDIDLSVSSICGISALSFVMLSNIMPMLLASIIVLLLGILYGYINSYIVVNHEVPAIVGTLGTNFFLRGCIYFLTAGFPRSFASGARKNILLKILSGKLFNTELSSSVVWLIVMTVIFTFILKWTPFGNHTFATGGDRNFTKYMGINVNRVREKNFIICSLLASFGGLISASRFLTVASTHSYAQELPAIASVAVGGTLMSGGYGSIEGTLIGVLLVSSLRSGLLLCGAPSYWYIGFMGIVLVLATILNIRTMKRRLIKK